MNWVDRRFARERNFAQAVDVWNSIVGAIHDVVESFNREGKYGRATVFSQNSPLLRIEVEQTHGNAYVRPTETMRRRVTIGFNNGNEPAITASLDAEPLVTFPIEADEIHCFVRHRGAEISPDDFSKIALEKAFFTPKTLAPARHLQHFTRSGGSSTIFS
jgi:hypothetical protein